MQENSHCRSHPAQSAVGICSICLKEKLGKLALSDKQPFPEPHEVGSSNLCTPPLSDFTKTNSGRNVDVGSVGRISFLIDKDRSNRPGSSDGFVLFSRSKSVASSAIGSLEDSSRCPPKTSSKKKASFWSFLYLRKRNNNHHHNNNNDGVLNDTLVGEDAGREGSADVNFLRLGPKVTRSRSVGYVGSRFFCGNQHRPFDFTDSAPRAFDPHQKTKMKGDEEQEAKTNVKCGRLFVGFGGVPSSSSSSSTASGMISYDFKDESARISGSHRRTGMGIF